MDQQMAELFEDIVTAVMDCIEREGMISRGKLEQAVAGVLATRKPHGAVLVSRNEIRISGLQVTGAVGGPQQPTITGNLVCDGVVSDVKALRGGPFALNPLTKSLRDRGLVRQTYMGKDFYVDPSDLEKAKFGDHGDVFVSGAFKMPAVEFNHKPSDKPLEHIKGEVKFTFDDAERLLKSAVGPEHAVVLDVPQDQARYKDFVDFVRGCNAVGGDKKD